MKKLVSTLILAAVSCLTQAGKPIGKAKEHEPATKSHTAQNVRARPQNAQGSIGQSIGAAAADGDEESPPANRPDAPKTSKGKPAQTNMKTIGQGSHTGYGFPKEHDAAKNITVQVNQLVASRTPEKRAAQRLLATIAERKRTLRNLQAQQRQGQTQSKDKLGNFEIQDLMSQYNHSEASLKKLLTTQEDLKSDR